LKYHLAYTYVPELEGYEYDYTSEAYSSDVPVNEREVKIAIDYVFNAIKVVSVPYNQTTIGEVAGQSNVQYLLKPQDTAYAIIEIQNVKSNLEILCSYALQSFTVDVEIVISDGTGGSEGNQTITERKKYDYGTTVGNVTTLWDNKLQASFEHTGWYKVNTVGGSSTETLLTEANGDFTKLINDDLYLKSYYKLGSTTSSKKVVFYHWNGDATGNYVEYANNENYILQGVRYNYLANGELVPTFLGYQYKDGDWQWLDGSVGENFFIIDADAYGTDDNGDPSISYGRLKQIPTINSWYPDSQFICYVALTDEHIKQINNTYHTNYIYMNQITAENIYFRVTNYYDDNTVDIVVEGTGPLATLVDGNGDPIQVKLEGVPVLTSTTPISRNTYAVQTYAIMNFSIDNKDHFTLTGANADEGTLVVDVPNYLDTVTFFEISNGNVVYYQKGTDKVRMITLNQTQYDAYVYARSAGATPETALYNVINNYSIAGSVVELDPSQTTYTQTLKANEYVFLFYYKKGGTSEIITICDTFFTAQTPVGGSQTALEFYPTTNNVRFNADTITVTRNETETTVDINRDNMRSSFTDKAGVVYNNKDMFFVVLDDVALNKFLELSQTYDREYALASVISTYSLEPSSGTTLEIETDAYIFAFYYTKAADGSVDTTSIEKIACNYVYINFETMTKHLIYINDLMFTSLTVDSLTYPSHEPGYDVAVDLSKMFATKTDYATGKVYGSDKLRLIAFSGSQFRLFADDVMNGFITPVEALQNATERLAGYTAVSASNQVGMLSFDIKYYILAYLVDDHGKVAVISTNLLEIVHSDELTEVKIVTLANALGFTIKSISTTKTSLTTADISINTDYINKTFINYATQEVIDQSRIRYIHLTSKEVEMIKEYYLDSRSTHTDGETGESYFGLRIKYGGSHKDFRNLTLEQAFELVIYYYRNLANTNSNPFKDQLVNNTDSLDEIIAGGYLPTTLYPVSSTTYEIDTSTDETEMNLVTGMYDHYMIAYVINTDNITVDKVASNYLHIEYAKSGSNIGSINTSVITLDSLIYG
jgi:hypothetical protein